jgi:hypothetical protein
MAPVRTSAAMHRRDVPQVIKAFAQAVMAEQTSQNAVVDFHASIE